MEQQHVTELALLSAGGYISIAIDRVFDHLAHVTTYWMSNRRTTVPQAPAFCPPRCTEEVPQAWARWAPHSRIYRWVGR
jgi:hypothetical protein